MTISHDHWKGEHLIRAPKRQTVCRQPGCGKRLDPRNASGVCVTHMHGRHCRCETCRGRASA